MGSRPMQTKQTKRRFRVCETCGELFYSVRSCKLHHGETGHKGMDHITATVHE